MIDPNVPESEPTYRGLVYPWHCDHMGHMNVMWYVGKFDEATWNLMARVGLTGAYLRSNGRGMVAVEQQAGMQPRTVDQRQDRGSVPRGPFD